MIWNGKTREQKRQDFKKNGKQHFAFIPTQMNDGTWVWMQKFYSVPSQGMFTSYYNEVFYGVTLNDAKKAAEWIARPAPPTPTKPQR